jgi:competence protein ComFC
MLEALLGFVFPPRCIFCNEFLEPGTKSYICSECFIRIPLVTKQNFLYMTANRQIYYDDVVCACEYSGIVRQALVKYKFFNKPSFYRAFAKLINDRLKNVTICRKFDIILSIPLHKNRENERGFNQARLISKALSKETGVPDRSWLLSRIRDTGNQSLLGRKQRLVNVRDAFKVNNVGKVKNKSILLIDDILTTGTTVNECSRVLKEAGASNIVVAVVASGRK